jgi:hypothetical protein
LRDHVFGHEELSHLSIVESNKNAKPEAYLLGRIVLAQERPHLPCGHGSDRLEVITDTRGLFPPKGQRRPARLTPGIFS